MVYLPPTWFSLTSLDTSGCSLLADNWRRAVRSTAGVMHEAPGSTDRMNLIRKRPGLDSSRSSCLKTSTSDYMRDWGELMSSAGFRLSLDAHTRRAERIHRIFSLPSTRSSIGVSGRGLRPRPSRHELLVGVGRCDNLEGIESSPVREQTQHHSNQQPATSNHESRRNIIWIRRL
jgi:hypothetical protein